MGDEVFQIYNTSSTKNLDMGKACWIFNLNLGTFLNSMNNLEITKLVAMYKSYFLSFYLFLVLQMIQFKP
jgi:hypothetical protein